MSTHFPFGSNQSPQIELDFAAQLPKASPRFDGETYEPKKDRKRLKCQLDKVRELMLDGRWRSLKQIAHLVNGTEAGVSARLRDLRKERFGAYTVNHRRIEGGLWKYQVIG